MEQRCSAAMAGVHRGGGGDAGAGHRRRPPGIFSVVDAVLLRPLPVSHPEELTALYSVYRGEEYVGDWSYPQYRDVRGSQQTFLPASPHNRACNLSVTIGDRAELFWGNIVSENFFSVLGMKPAAGQLSVARGRSRRRRKPDCRPTVMTRG